jgi:hypothetical protein
MKMPVPFEKRTIEYQFIDNHVNNENGRRGEPKQVKSNKKVFGRTNSETWQFMKNRFVVIRNFLPEEMITFALDVWKAQDEAGGITEQENRDITYKNPIDSIGKSEGKYCSPQGIALSHYIHKKLDDYIDMDLRETYSYTRKYVRGAYLGSHTDRPSCEVSATLCLDYQTDDGSPWTIWVRNDRNYAGVDAEVCKNESQDYSHRDRVKNGCIPVELEPGDILLYQGPNIPHWRDYLLGDYSYHIFTHFVNADSFMMNLGEGEFYGVDLAEGQNRMKPKETIALQLDGRPNRWSDDNETKTPKSDMANMFNDKYYATNYGEYVNNYDDMELVTKK